MSTDKKLIGIVASVVVAIVVVIAMTIAFVPNRAYSMENGIEESQANITVKEKRRNTLVVNLVDTIKSYTEYEASTMEAIVAARQAAVDGDIATAQSNINIVVEAYPELKADTQYTHLMNELSIGENSISDARQSLNRRIRDYKFYVRKFPTRLILSWASYDVQDYSFIAFEGESTLENIWE